MSRVEGVAPLCEKVRRGSRIPGTNRFNAVPCGRRAVMRILLSHGPGVARYGSRCPIHTEDQLGQLVAAVWDELEGEWVERQPIRGWC